MTFRSQSLSAAVACLLCMTPLQVQAQPRPPLEGGELLREADRTTRNEGVSPVRRIQRELRFEEPLGPSNLRNYDGSDNNLQRPLMGAADTPLGRLTFADYADGVSALAGQSRPNPRLISNVVASQPDTTGNAQRASDFLWQWGQFLDHDFTLSDGMDPPEPSDIEIPLGDALFDPDRSGDAVLVFNRSLHDGGTSDPDGVRQQINEVTAWIDASNVYGSHAERAQALRVLDGSGRLDTSEGELLPYNLHGYANAGGDSEALFLGGDVRANEQVGLTAMHTLFVREHNRLAEQIAAQAPALDGDAIYQRARALVEAQIQVITYNEFLPLLLGGTAIAPYSGYDPSVDASIFNEFSTAAFRLGHSMLSSQLLRVDADGSESEFGNLPLRNAFFAPDRIATEGGIEPILRGLAQQMCNEIDVFVVDDVRNFLFGQPGSGGLDLVALNIQRGRDHGLASYNDVRESLGLARRNSFAEVTSDARIEQRLASAYASVDDIDLWVGGLAEDNVRGAMVGELFLTILVTQFESLRDGDRFWYARTLSRRDRDAVERTRLSDVIRRNTTIGRELPDDVFRVSRQRNLSRR